MVKNNLKRNQHIMQTLNFISIHHIFMDDENLPAQCHPIPKSKKKKQKEPNHDTV